MDKDIVNRGKLNIGLDFDGVIIDHSQNKIKVAESLGFRIKVKQTPSHILKNILPGGEYKKLQKAIYGKLTLKAPPVLGAFKAIQDLSKSRNYNLYIISRRESPRIALAWLKKYKILNYIPRKNIFFIKEDKEKNKLAKKLKLKVFLDDKISVLESLLSVSCRVFFNHQLVTINKKFLEIKSWREFTELMEKLKLNRK